MCTRHVGESQRNLGNNINDGNHEQRKVLGTRRITKINEPMYMIRCVGYLTAAIIGAVNIMSFWHFIASD